MTAIWVESTIDGRPVSVADYFGRRLYVCERFHRIQAWIDGVKIGDFCDIDAAKIAAVKAAVRR
jgi:hypothetical protein